MSMYFAPIPNCNVEATVPVAPTVLQSATPVVQNIAAPIVGGSAQQAASSVAPVATVATVATVPQGGQENIFLPSSSNAPIPATIINAPQYFTPLQATPLPQAASVAPNVLATASIIQQSSNQPIVGGSEQQVASSVLPVATEAAATAPTAIPSFFATQLQLPSVAFAFPQTIQSMANQTILQFLNSDTTFYDQAIKDISLISTINQLNISTLYANEILANNGLFSSISTQFLYASIGDIPSIFISSINGGPIEDLNPAGWANYQAVQSVDLSGNNIYNIASVSTSGLTASTINVSSLVVVDINTSTIYGNSGFLSSLGVSSINGTAVEDILPANWWKYPAGGTVNMANHTISSIYDLVGDIYNDPAHFNGMNIINVNTIAGGVAGMTIGDPTTAYLVDKLNTWGIQAGEQQLDNGYAQIHGQLLAYGTAGGHTLATVPVAGVYTNRIDVLGALGGISLTSATFFTAQVVGATSIASGVNTAISAGGAVVLQAGTYVFIQGASGTPCSLKFTNGGDILQLNNVDCFSITPNQINARGLATSIDVGTQLNMNNHAIYNLPNPNNPGDATNKAYVDSLSSGSYTNPGYGPFSTFTYSSIYGLQSTTTELNSTIVGNNSTFNAFSSYTVSSINDLVNTTSTTTGRLNVLSTYTTSTFSYYSTNAVFHFDNPVVIGQNANPSFAGTGSISIGTNAGQSNVGTNTVNIGTNAGQYTAQSNSVNIGTNAGQYNINPGGVCIGRNAGTFSSLGAVAVGEFSGNSFQGQNAVAIGNVAGFSSQGVHSIAIGNGAAQFSQADDAIAIGTLAGLSTQGLYSIAIGINSGTQSQLNNCVAIGRLAGAYYQSTNAISIGYTAGYSNQGSNSISIGYTAGTSNQGANSIAIGYQAGRKNQGVNSIGIGTAAGLDFLSTQSIAIGTLVSTVRENSIVLSAIPGGVQGTKAYCTYIANISSTSATEAYQNSLLFYNPTSRELSYGAQNYGITVQASGGTIAPLPTQRGRVFVLTGTTTTTISNANLTANDAGFFIYLKNGNPLPLGSVINLLGVSGQTQLIGPTSTTNGCIVIAYWNGTIFYVY